MSNLSLTGSLVEKFIAKKLEERGHLKTAEAIRGAAVRPAGYILPKAAKADGVLKNLASVVINSPFSDTTVCIGPVAASKNTRNKGNVSHYNLGLAAGGGENSKNLSLFYSRSNKPSLNIAPLGLAKGENESTNIGLAAIGKDKSKNFSPIIAKSKKDGFNLAPLAVGEDESTNIGIIASGQNGSSNTALLSASGGEKSTSFSLLKASGGKDSTVTGLAAKKPEGEASKKYAWFNPAAYIDPVLGEEA